MPSEFTVRALDATVCIAPDDTLDEFHRNALAVQWSDLRVDEPARVDTTIRVGIGPNELEIRSVDERRLVAESFEFLADRLATEVTVTGMRSLQGRALMLHAAAVDVGDGRVIAFVGPSGRGKTTAAQALAKEFGYVTDETVAIERDGTVVSYRKPLSIGSRPGSKQHIPASGMGLRVAGDAGLELAAVVLLDRRPEVTMPWVEQVPLAEGLPELVRQTSFLTLMHRPLRTIADRLVATGGVRRVVYGEAETLPAIVDDILATVDPEPPMLVDVDSRSKRDCGCVQDLVQGEPITTNTPLEEAPSGSYRRTSHADALMVDDSLFVLKEQDVLLLEGVGPIVWLGAEDSSEDELRETALSQLPEPPEGVDPSAVVAGAISDLVDAGLLSQRP
ncbi:hypothetical protein ARHIZOSPH14_15970 [Agromyces rhizosphaerae]|uniref:Uncharacterized protein n=1 Tax=Agromyces rhizosphaerae TaxID=88374 RepID=A0A9W6CVX8_9MICO|nr:ATP-binding protein [Agromyces rhizosphaerae]GLI27355.1 hypothetical protein ARHIZOSPH14_15970 [Agromyces rhizosphaerae]